MDLEARLAASMIQIEVDLNQESLDRSTIMFAALMATSLTPSEYQDYRSAPSGWEHSLRQILATGLSISEIVSKRVPTASAMYFHQVPIQDSNDDYMADDESLESDDEIFGEAQVKVMSTRAIHPRLPRPHYLEVRRDFVSSGGSFIRLAMEDGLLSWSDLLTRSNQLVTLGNEVLLDLLKEDKIPPEHKLQVFNIFGQRCAPIEHFILGKFPRKFWNPTPWWLSYYADEYRFVELGDLISDHLKLRPDLVFYIQSKITALSHTIPEDSWGVLHLLEDHLREKYPKCYLEG